MSTVGNGEVEDLFRSSYTYVMRLIRAMGVDENDIEDVAADVFADALKSFNKGNRPDNVKPWLSVCAANRARRHFRSRARRREISNMVKSTLGEIDMFDNVADEDTVEKMMYDTEQREMVREMVRILPDLSRKILHLRFWGEYKHSEIADILKINLNTEKSLYRRALKALEEEYARICGKEEPKRRQNAAPKTCLKDVSL